MLASLSWEPPAEGEVASYRVYASSSMSTPFQMVGESTGVTFDFTDGLAGLPYFFKVTAVDPEGDRVGLLGCCWSRVLALVGITPPGSLDRVLDVLQVPLRPRRDEFAAAAV